MSIIMPTYNVAEYLSAAIESVLAQSFQDWEIIIVNDGSPDSSPEIGRKYTTKDPRIRVVDKPNGGLSDARNFGLKYASGTYIHFFDPDDYLKGEFYQPLFKSAVETDCDVLITGYTVELESEKGSQFVERHCPFSFNGTYNRKNPLYAFNFVCYAWNKLFRREFLLAHGLEYEKGLSRIEDAEFMSRFITFNPKVTFADNSAYTYVQRDITTLSKGFDENIISISARRQKIDTKLMEFFFHPSQSELAKNENIIKLESTLSLISRLYGVDRNLRHRRKYYLDKIRALLPSKYISTSGNISQRIYNCLIYFALKNRLYFIITLLRKVI